MNLIYGILSLIGSLVLSDTTLGIQQLESDSNSLELASDPAG